MAGENDLRIRPGRIRDGGRGYVPLGGELTSGRPDLKEGLYLGTELGADGPQRCRQGSNVVVLHVTNDAATPGSGGNAPMPEG